MTTYEYDENKDSLLSVFDSLVGTYRGRDDTHIFKTKAGTITFSCDLSTAYNNFSVKVDEIEVIFGWYHKNKRVPDGIIVKTDIGIFRPQDMNFSKETTKRHCTSINNLTIRQLSDIAKEAITQYKELLGD